MISLHHFPLLSLLCIVHMCVSLSSMQVPSSFSIPVSSSYYSIYMGWSLAQIWSIPCQWGPCCIPNLFYHWKSLLFYFTLFIYFTRTDLFKTLIPCFYSHLLKQQNIPAFSPVENKKSITMLTFHLQLSSWALISRFLIIFVRPRLYCLLSLKYSA